MATTRKTSSLARSTSFLLAMLLVACDSDSSLRDPIQSVQQEPTGTSAITATVERSNSAAPATPIYTPRPMPRSGGVADLLADRPPPGESVELDAWFGEGRISWPGRGRFESMSGCPTVDSAPMLDRPLWQTIGFGSSMSSNPVPDDAPHLIAAFRPELAGQEGEDPVAFPPSDWPAFARVRGHFPTSDEAFQSAIEAGNPCPDHDRIFVIDALLETYLPAREYLWVPVAPEARWIRFRSLDLGLSLSHPPSWQVIESGDELTLVSPHWPDRSMRIRRASPSSDPIGAPTRRPASHAESWGHFFQEREAAARFGDNQASLEGEIAGCHDWDDERLDCLELNIATPGQTYQVRIPFGRGFDAEPGQLRVADQIVDSLAIEAWPTMTPRPPIHTKLGGGPYWDRARAEEMALSMIGGADGIPGSEWQVSDARLISESEALDLARCSMDRSPDNSWYPYPDGVWLIELSAAPDIVYTTYLDAANGFHICTAKLGEPVESGGGALSGATRAITRRDLLSVRLDDPTAQADQVIEGPIRRRRGLAELGSTRLS